MSRDVGGFSDRAVHGGNLSLFWFQNGNVGENAGAHFLLPAKKSVETGRARKASVINSSSVCRLQ
jgi:hypothetical protein